MDLFRQMFNICANCSSFFMATMISAVTGDDDDLTIVM